MKDEKNLITSLNARTFTYSFFRDAYLERPEPKMLDDLRKVLEVWNGVALNTNWQKGELLLKEFLTSASGGSDSLWEDLRWDYVRLFVGPYKLPAPPFESVYRENSHLVMQEVTMKVRERYKACQLQVRNLNSFPDDHIGIEFEFMYFLITKTKEALLRREEREWFRLLDLQREFLNLHLLQWVPSFCDDVFLNAQTDLYKGIALITKGFLQEEEVIIPSLSQERWVKLSPSEIMNLARRCRIWNFPW